MTVSGNFWSEIGGRNTNVERLLNFIECNFSKRILRYATLLFKTLVGLCPERQRSRNTYPGCFLFR